MVRWHKTPLLATLLLLLAATTGRADRTPSQKASMPHSWGARGDITVPYLTNGSSTLRVYDMVSPRIYSSPRLDDPQNHGGARPVYNIIFYGSQQGFGAGSTGATPRPAQSVRPNGN